MAAADALASRRVRRVAVVDWDVHHGNGTQHIFDAEPRVLFTSLHRFGSRFFPGSGALGEVGEGEARGRTLNVPWQQTGLGDTDYAAVRTQPHAAWLRRAARRAPRAAAPSTRAPLPLLRHARAPHGQVCSGRHSSSC